MSLNYCTHGMMLSIVATTALLLGGCGKSQDKPAPVAAKTTVHDHGDWWCDEHGVPEEVCTRCNAKLIAGYKKKGDWCEEHGRPKSQCFKCNPKLQEEFANLYREKEGKEPPAITDP